MAFSRDTVLASKLRVVRLIGEGGLGEVYEVEHLFTRHRRALKVLKPQWRTDGELVERFLREASAAGHIGNPHIVETFDAGTLEDGSPYLLMELLEGQPLDVVLRWHGRLEVGVAVRIMLQVCDAMSAAHETGIVHRDLKPENLFLLKRDGRHFVKVLDFGISKFDSGLTGRPKVTNTFSALGTPLYMSPEQMRATKDVDGRADIYSMAVILYEAIAGTTPFVADSYAELAAQALRGEAKPLHELVRGVPPVLSRIVARAMAVDLRQRHASPRELADELEPFATDGVTSLTEMPKERPPGSPRLDERQPTVSPWGPTAPPAIEASPALTEEATPVARRPGETTVRPFRLRPGLAVVVVLGGIVAGGLAVSTTSATHEAPPLAEVEPPSEAPSRSGRAEGPAAPTPATRAAEEPDAAALNPPEPPQLPALAQREGGRVDAGRPSSPPAPLEGSARPRPTAARATGFLRVTCNQEPCRVLLPGGETYEAPFMNKRSGPGTVVAVDATGRRTAPFPIVFKTPGESISLEVDLESGTISRR
ncbi:MAG: protein kinase [Myxococcaceae bacterium]|nr:protein kinase [Myxococcaceae bacterium]